MKIRMKSVTYAMKSKDVLHEAGIDAAVVKDLRPRGGCIYAITFPDKDREMATVLLQRAGVVLHISENWEDYQ